MSKTEHVSIEKKLLLSPQEASKYTGIGLKRMRNELQSPGCTYSIWVGERCYAVRELMEKYYINQAKNKLL